MAPTESAILQNFLLTPSELPAIITPKEFAALFPRQQPSSTQIRSLYRDLQARRNAVVDVVASNIEKETKIQSKKLRWAVIQAWREAESQEYDQEIEIERSLFGAASGLEGPKLDLRSVLPELENSISELEDEINRLEEEERELRQSLHQTVGSMSDLRYGRLANSQLPAQVLEGLTDLDQTCKRRA